MTTADRAERAWSAIDGYADNECLDDAVTDILADLQHLCRQEDIDFAACLRMASGHYEEESR